MTTSWQIRAETAHDHEAVGQLHRAAFGGDHGGTVALLVSDLRRRISGADGLSLIASQGDEVVGHVLFTESLLDAPSRLVRAQVLSPLAVRPDLQRRGIGSALIAHGLDLLAERGVPLVFLEGDPRYYGPRGFQPGGELGFRKPSLRIPDAAFLVRRLPAYEDWMTGTLVYSEPFWTHDCVGLRTEHGHHRNSGQPDTR